MSYGVRLLVLVVALFLPLRAQFNPDELLSRAVARVRDTLHHLPNYLCTETMQRYESWGRPGGSVSGAKSAEGGCEWLAPAGYHPSTQTDRVRVDVLFTSSGESYSWTGENQFQNEDLLSLLHIREVSIGSFGGLLRSIFAGNNAFTYRGETIESGRTLPAYSFRVPREKSEYWFGTGSDRRLVAFEGTFLLDPETADLVRLNVRPSDSPEVSGACRATTTVSYGRTRLSNAEVLLPTQAVFDFVGAWGKEARNSWAYSDCHEFRAESTLRFEGPATEGYMYGYQPSLVLPEGLPFRVAFAQDISYGTAAAGDTFSAKLATPIQDGSGHILVPAGTKVVARILHAEMTQGGGITRQAHLIFRLESLVMAGLNRPFVATTAQRIESDDPFDDDGVYKGYKDPDVAAFVFAPNVAMLKFYGIPQGFILKAGKQSKWRTGGTGPTVDCLKGAKPCN